MPADKEKLHKNIGIEVGSKLHPIIIITTIFS